MLIKHLENCERKYSICSKKNERTRTIETISRLNDPNSPSEKMEYLAKPGMRKHSFSYDEVMPQLRKKGNSCANYLENYSYIVVAENVLETVEALKRRKMSI